MGSNEGRWRLALAQFMYGNEADPRIRTANGHVHFRIGVAVVVAAATMAGNLKRIEGYYFVHF